MIRAVLALVTCLPLLAAAPAAAAKTPIPGVRTPSRNIECLYVPGPLPSLHCDIHSSSYAAKLQNRCIKRASLDWHGLELGRKTKGAVTCSGGILYSPDTQRPVYRILAYGRTWKHGGFTCSSATAGLTCRNAKGHGVFISRASWRVW
jgi:Family of unknown function (DUF6636)